MLTYTFDARAFEYEHDTVEDIFHRYTECNHLRKYTGAHEQNAWHLWCLDSLA